MVPSVNVVILNFNGRRWLERFLPSVCATRYESLSITVADNCSEDDSLGFLRERFPEVRLLCLERNFGFAEGYNRALEQLPGDIFVLLNSDVEVPPDWLSALVHPLLEDPRVAAVQPKIRSFHQPECFEYAGAAGGLLDALGYPFCRGRLFEQVDCDEGQYDTPAEIFWASGAAMAVRAELFRCIGGFDGDFFAHLEEIDLCWRLKRAGYRVVFCPESVVWHVGGGTLGYESPRKTFLNFRNNHFMLWRNEATRRLAWLFPLRLLLDGVAGLQFLLKGRPAHTLAIVRAHLALYRALPRLLRKRREVRRQVESCRIGPSRDSKGRYRGSIVWWHFVLGRKHLPPLS